MASRNKARARLWGWMLALACAMPVAAPAAEPIAVEKFFKRAQFGKMALSPTGDYIAATVPLEDRTALIVLRRSDLKQTAVAMFAANEHVDWFTWVNPKRLLHTVAVQKGKYAAPRSTGLVYGLNADGTGTGSIGSGGYALIDTLRNDDDYVQIEYADDRGRTVLSRMNVNNGYTVGPPLRSPIANADFITDNASKVRFVIGRMKREAESRLYRYAEGGDWELVNEEGATGNFASVAGFSADNNTAYLISEEANGPDALYAYDMRTGTRTQLLRDDNVDVHSLLSSPVDGSVYAARLLDGRPRVEYLDSANPFAVSLKQMQEAFPGSDVLPMSYTDDGKLAVYLVHSDVQPGEFYVLDRVAGKATFLAALVDWLPQESLAPMEPISFTARDGLKLEGFLTLPRGAARRNLPLIVHPHGGPRGIYDTWEFDPEVQLLANRGYAVLQVNFRGSGNYGRGFLEKGDRQWGRAMQDDLADATRWAIAQGIADASRICIYGASYGGYAALMGPIHDPGLYRCAIGNVGVYDMPSMRRDDTLAGSVGREVFDEQIGTGEDMLSPSRMGAQVRIPVLLAAGKEDNTAPPKHTEMMRDALTAAGTPVDTVFYAGEGHGNVLLKNQVDWANRVLAFLNQHLGPGTVATAMAAPAVAGGDGH